MDDRPHGPPTQGEIRVARCAVLRTWTLRVVGSMVLFACFVLIFSYYGTVGVGQIVSSGGLVLDVIGIFMLARGALISAEEIAAIGTYGDMEGKQRRPAAIRLRTEGYFGVAIATLGFLLQFVGSWLPSTWTITLARG